MTQHSNNLRFARALLATNVKATLMLRGAFVMQVAFMALNNLTFFVFWWALMRRVPDLRGWRLGDIQLLFVLGGLMMPIELYPELIRRLAPFTPFPSILAGPASFVLYRTSAEAGVHARTLSIWACVTAVAVCWVFRRAASALTVNGG